MKRQIRADLFLSAAVVFLGASLVFSGYSLLRLHRHADNNVSGLALPELLGVGAAGAGIALLCWWLFAMMCAFIAAFAHARGSVKVAAISATFAPAFMRRVVVAVLGLNLLAAPLANAAESPGTSGVDPRWHPDTVAVSVTAPDGQDPLPARNREAVVPTWVPQTAQTNPDLLVRADTRAAHGATGVPGPGQAPASDIPTEPPALAEALPSDEQDIVVKAGDTLWSIVAAALGPYASDVDVAQSWPEWYRANRSTIGANPNIIHPGQILHAP